MVKNIVITIASGLVVLLVLAFSVLVVFNYRDYFSDVIIWLVLGLIGILALFTIYMVISRLVDAVRHKGRDVEELSEQHIEQILTTGEMNAKNIRAAAAEKQEKAKKGGDKRGRKQPPVEKKTNKKQEAFAQKKAAEEAARLRKEQEAAAKQQPAVPAQPVVGGELPQNQPEPKPAVASAEIPFGTSGLPKPPGPGAFQEPATPANEEPARKPADAEDAKRQAEATQREAEIRRQQAVESARHQAEAAAAARRKAAAMAARSQSFPAIKTEQIPAFNTGVLEQAASTTDSRAHIFAENEPVPAGTPVQNGTYHSGNIWEQMNVRQNAAPILSGQQPRTPQVHPVQQPVPQYPAAPQPYGQAAYPSQHTGMVPPAVQQPVYPPATAGQPPYATEHPAPPSPAENQFPISEPQHSGYPPVGEQPSLSTGYAAQPHQEPQPPAGQSAPVHPEYMPHSPAADVVPPWEQPAQPAMAGLDAAQQTTPESADWTYSPAKPPKAWNTGGRMPGDMSSFATQNATASESLTPKGPAARTEEAKAKAAAAEAHAVSAKAKTAASKAKAKTSANTEEKKASPAATTPEGEPVKRPRGRPPKPKTEEELNKPKRPRGRPPKPKTEEELNKPKRPRGRPPKPKTEEELNKPKRPRGRPRKNPLPEEQTAANADTAKKANTASPPAAKTQPPADSTK